MAVIPVRRLLLNMAWPMMLSMLVSSLYNIVDSYFVAQISEDAMTSLSLVYPIQNIVTAVTVGFGIGINVLVAFYLGAKNQKVANNATTLGLLCNIFHGILLTIICTILYLVLISVLSLFYIQWSFSITTN